MPTALGLGCWMEKGWMQICQALQRLISPSLLRGAMPFDRPALQTGGRNGLGFREKENSVAFEKEYGKYGLNSLREFGD